LIHFLPRINILSVFIYAYFWCKIMSITRTEMEEVLRDASRRGYFGTMGGGGNTGGGATGGGNTSGTGGGILDRAAEKVAGVLGSIGAEFYDSTKKVSDQNYN
jgi:hypothetical protein